MKHLLVLAAVVVAAQAWGSWTPGLNVRFDIGLGVGRDFFISVPQTLTQAKNNRWVESTRPEGQSHQDLVLYNPSLDDVLLGAFYDSTGKVAGIQVAFPDDTFTNYPFDWTVQGYLPWTAPADSSGNIRTYQTTAVFFVSEATLAKSAAERSDRIYEEDFVYVTGFNGELLPVSTTASTIASDSDFTRQNCIPFMGRHYFYNLTTTGPECTGDQLFPWFALVDEADGVDQLLGVGVIALGTLPADQLTKDYFERPSETAVRLIANSAPECLYESVATYGLVTMHIYFVDTPLLINCFST